MFNRNAFVEFDKYKQCISTLHWLPIDARIKYKLCSLCFGDITSSGTVYLSDLLKIYTLSRQHSLQTSVYCSFHLSTLSHTVNALSLTLLQHSGTHFQKISDILSQFLPLDQHSRPTLFQHRDIVLIN